MSSTDYLRGYTAPRALLVGALFVLAVACRVPAVLAAVAVHVLDRCADRLVGFAEQFPPAPIPTMTRTARRCAR